MSPIFKSGLRLQRAADQHAKQVGVFTESVSRFSDGYQFENLYEMTDGDWVELEPGILSKTKDAGSAGQYLSLWESVAIKDTDGTNCHRHTVEDQLRNQVIYVLEGSLTLRIHESCNGPITHEFHILPTHMGAIYPNEWHSKIVTQGTKYISIYLPAIPFLNKDNDD